jgi:triosephosphate isomerase
MVKIIVSNWKMNGSFAFIEAFIPSLADALASTSNHIIICPPFPFLSALRSALKSTSAHVGAQNCHTVPQGAFTGEVSAAMLADMGCQAVIVGHSERRALFLEDDALVSAKAAVVHEAGMTAIICVGETVAVRQSGCALDTVAAQLRASLPPSATSHNTLIAYEPIWAIGTGVTASLEEIAAMHEALRKEAKLPVLYGGSVTEQNAAGILSLPHVDGVLVGGASLKLDAFQKILAC